MLLLVDYFPPEALLVEKLCDGTGLIGPEIPLVLESLAVGISQRCQALQPVIIDVLPLVFLQVFTPRWEGGGG